MPKKQKADKVGNRQMMAAFQGLRMSNAAGTHLDKRTKRARTRADQKRRAVKEWE